MNTDPAVPSNAPLGLHEPFWRFCGSHAGIRDGLQRLGDLPGLAETLKRARDDASATLKLFEQQVVGHHGDEESELFVAVARSAQGTDDEARVRALVERLTSEHRAMERLWARIRPAVAAVAAGKPGEHEGFAEDAAELMAICRDHARLEEEVFFPLADSILARNPNHLAALDLSLYMRHVRMPRVAYL